MQKTENRRFYGLTAIIFIFLCCSISINAATFNVTKISDTNDGVCDTDCSLREAVAAANTAATDDIITFNSPAFNTVSTITLGGTPLSIQNNGKLTINGLGSNLLAVSGNNQSRILSVETSADVSISGLKITGGNSRSSPFTGGAIYSLGSLNLVNSIITGNSAPSGGGGIYQEAGTLNITTSNISGNTISNERGAGIFCTCTLNITNSTIENNIGGFGGGGIYASGNVTITGSTINANRAGNGAGIQINNGTFNLISSSVTNNLGGSAVGVQINLGTSNITDSIISNNTAGAVVGAGVYNAGSTLTINNSIISGNAASNSEGGGLYNGSYDNVPGTVSISNSIISGNSANQGAGIDNHGNMTVSNCVIKNNTTILNSPGGGIYNDSFSGTLTVINTTISGNTARNGGGIYNFQGTVNLTNLTIHNNSATQNGGGIYNGFQQPLNARNTIIGDNTSTISAPDFSGTLISQGYNLIENITGTTITGNATGNILGQDAQLTPLRNNGGPTETVGLLPTSPAIDRGDPNNFPPTDQRGIVRSQDGDMNGTNLPDIGAYERQLTFYPVTKTVDTADGACDADCSLREAVLATNTATTPDNVIVFDPQVFGSAQTITLNGTELNISGSGTLVILGTGAAKLTVNGNNLSRVFYFGLNSKVLVSKLKISGGRADNWGGGLINEGWLAITSAAIENNRSGYVGGGIYNKEATSNLTIIDSSISNNVVSKSSGGGVTSDGKLSIINSSITGNTGVYGGGVIVREGTAIITGSVISGNAASDGGGVCTWYNGNPSIIIRDSLISENTASFGGGILIRNGNISLTNTTISSNRGYSLGGGIYVENSGVVNLTHVTIAKNVARSNNDPSGFGGGVQNTSGTVNARNTIFANNTAGTNGSDFRGTLTSQGYILVK